MNPFFDTIKCIYYKTEPKFEIEYSTQLSITLSKWLARDKDNLNVIKNLLPYLFYLEPKHYFFLLYLNIRRKTNIPYFKKIIKIKEKDNKLLKKLQSNIKSMEL